MRYTAASDINICLNEDIEILVINVLIILLVYL